MLLTNYRDTYIYKYGEKKSWKTTTTYKRNDIYTQRNDVLDDMRRIQKLPPPKNDTAILWEVARHEKDINFQNINAQNEHSFLHPPDTLNEHCNHKMSNKGRALSTILPQLYIKEIFNMIRRNNVTAMTSTVHKKATKKVTEPFVFSNNLLITYFLHFINEKKYPSCHSNSCVNLCCY